MGHRDARAVGVLWAVVLVVGFASCGGEGSGGSADAEAGAGAGGEPQLHDGGTSSVAGAESQAGAGAGGRVMTLGGAGGSGAGQGGLAGGGGSGAGEAALGGGGGTSSDCPAMATVECDEIVAGASYDASSSTLTLQLPARVEVEMASLGVTFLYANGDPEDYADVPGTIEGSKLTFDFSAHEGSGISHLSAEPWFEDSCGDNVNVHAPGVGFGPAIMVELEHGQGAGGAGGAANAPNIVCGHTN